jgi:hypothetical protein
MTPVLDDVVGADPADGGECGLAALPEQGALDVVLGDAHLECAGLGAEAGHLLELAVDRRLGAVELDDEDGAGALWVSALDGRLGGLDGQRVHHFDRGRDDAGADDRGDGLTGGVGIREGREHRLHGLRQAGQLDGDLRRDPQRALGADNRAEQVVSGKVDRLAADLHQLAERRDELDARHVSGGEAVLEAVGATGVLSKVAADRTDLLARRVGSEVVPVRLRGLRQLEIDDARFDDGALVVEVDLEDVAHLRHHDQDAVGVRQGPSGEAGSRAPGDEGYASGRAGLHDGGHLFGGFRQDHQGGMTR